MQLNIRALTISVAVMTAFLSILCVLATAIAPGKTMEIFGYLTHIDVSSIPRPLTLLSSVLGIIGWTVAAAIVAAIGGSLYNRIVGKG